MHTVKSPLTGRDNVLIEDTIQTRDIIEQYDKLYGVDVSRFFVDTEQIGIYQCRDTQFRFYYPFHTDGDGRFYEHFQQYDWYYVDWKWEHATVEALLKKTDKVLEIGCGRGSFIEKLTSEGIRCTGLELNADAVRYARQKGLPVTAESVQRHAAENPAAYDVVCSFQVMEHIAAVGEVIQASVDALKTGGKLMISVPNNDSYAGWDNNCLNMPPHHMGLWNRKSLANLQKVYNLTLNKIYLEPLQPHHIPYCNSVLYKVRFEKYQRRLKAYGLLGRIANRAETLLEPILYPTLRNYTIIAEYTKI